VVLHLLPVGIVTRFKRNLVGPYMVCDPGVLVKELAIADAYKSEVFLDPRAAVVLPIHKLLDGGREDASGNGAIGTTKKGIGPCYEDYVSRRGLRLGNLTDADAIRAELERGRYYEEKLALAAFHKIEGVPSLDETVAWAASFIRAVQPRLADTVEMARQAATAGKCVIFEGAQGVNLDIVAGMRPYQTSSFCGAGGVSASFGITRFDRVTGVAKAYATRVGGGPFPSEMCEADDETLRQAGSEFGATTGRSRRCGWLDLPLLRASCDAGGITELVINKVDVLGKAFAEFQVCVRDGKYVKLPGWGDDVHFRNLRLYKHLPVGAQILFDLIEKYTDRPVVGIGTGPASHDIIWERD
ncbi:adenylosuccinate synthetase, partial [Candidatus Uhrbacteria bacterium]|nr:adenylosuccinate synthetase [Candidatus Uhrbacteria bacterium]